ncbi:DUF305 domain-containing protein [Kribbella sp. ALI-6-A]|uniref:DUF305 domain-containing protein n=1 Tax=Kribbella sp. ALI-6-A TaxID=1933817 RepID=UPI00097C27FC|nr:DUF305 domain-containing protein [Kribbella sp. ALI-6-A]ONI76718.1 DUF305 domain-containing protein [Kribbella sp. ALI-6-A]
MKALACVVLLASVTACGSSAASPPPSTPTPAGTPSATASVWDIDPSFNATDLAWIELMIPMDEQLLRVLELGRKQAADPAVREFAGRVAAGHRAEVARFVALRTRSRLPVRNPHQGHDMPGMMTEPEIVALGKSTGAAFDQVFLENLEEHLEQSIVLARSIPKDGKDPEGKKLATAITTTRAAQLKELAALR